MIIRLTVNDNDYSEQIALYFKDFIMRMYELHPDNCFTIDDDPREIMAWRKREFVMRKLLNPNNDIIWDETNKNAIINQVKRTFHSFLEVHLPDDIEYLERNLEVDVIAQLKDEWENGEVFYWLQHAGVAINQ